MRYIAMTTSALALCALVVSEAPAQRIVARRGATVQINNGVGVGQSAIVGHTGIASASVVGRRGNFASASFGLGGYRVQTFAPSRSFIVGGTGYGAVRSFDPGVSYSYGLRSRALLFDPGLSYSYGGYGVQQSFALPSYYTMPQQQLVLSAPSYTTGGCSVMGGTQTYALPPRMEPVQDEATTMTTPYKRRTTIIEEEGGQSTTTRTYSQQYYR
jgi:hypothetical protein